MATKTDITVLPYRERVALVRERMKGLRYPKIESLPKPAKVLAAEKIVREFEAKDQAYEDQQRSDFRSKLNTITDALIVGDTAKAVALLNKLGA